MSAEDKNSALMANENSINEDSDMVIQMNHTNGMSTPISEQNVTKTPNNVNFVETKHKKINITIIDENGEQTFHPLFARKSTNEFVLNYKPEETPTDEIDVELGDANLISANKEIPVANKKENEIQFVCEWIGCGKPFKLNAHLNQHKRYVHFKECHFKCPYKDCGKGFFSKKYLNKHKRLGHSKERQLEKSREVYKQEFYNQEQIASNQLIINSEKSENSVPTDIVTENLKVSVGSEETPNQHFLNNESQSKDISEKVSNKRQFVCDWIRCQKRFTTKSHLNQHKRYVHLKEWPFKCHYKDCGKGFINKQQLRKHKRIIHMKEKQLEKSPNQEQIASKQLITNSEKSDNSVPTDIVSGNLKVSVGSEETPNQHFLNNESQTKDISKEVSNKSKIVCNLIRCRKQFTTKSQLYAHNRTVHLKERRFKCDYKRCEKRFFIEQNLFYHKLLHLKEFSYKSNKHKRKVHSKERQLNKSRKICKQELYNQEQNTTNQLIINSGIEIEDLKDSVGSEETLNQHILVNENEIKNISEEVTNIYANVVPIKLETISDNSENSDNSVPNNIEFEYFTNILKLNVGSEKTQNHNFLIQSEDVCEEISNERQFVCDWIRCRKRFKRKQYLIRHKRCVHLKERQFKCDYKNCGKRFFSQQNLKNHKRIHSGKKPFHCDHKNCRQSFTEKSSLNKHKRNVHLKERQFKCDYKDCEKSFFYKNDLTQHKRIHSGEKPFVCEHKNCGQKFKQQSNLTKHKRIVHLKESELKMSLALYQNKLHNQEKNTSNQLIINLENGDNSVPIENITELLNSQARSEEIPNQLKNFNEFQNISEEVSNIGANVVPVNLETISDNSDNCDNPVPRSIVTEDLKVIVGSEDTRDQHFVNNESQSNDISEEVSNKQFVCGFIQCGKRFNTKKAVNQHKRSDHSTELQIEKPRQSEQQDNHKTLNQQESDNQKQKTTNNQPKSITEGEPETIVEQNMTESSDNNCITAFSRLAEGVDSENIPHSGLQAECQSTESYWPSLLFGIFPVSLINSAMNGPVQGMSQLYAIKEILETIKNAPLNKLAEMLSTMEQFIYGLIEFKLLEHNTPEVSLTALYIFRILVERLKSSMTPFLPTIVAVLAKRFGDGRPVVRTSVVQTFQFLMYYFPPQQVLDLLLTQESNDPKVRVEIINRVTYTALTVPSSFIDPTSLWYSVGKMLTDKHQIVRLAALESLAVLGPALNFQKLSLFLSAVEELESTYHLKGLVAAIHTRLARKALPRCKPDGTVEYILNPRQYSCFSQVADIKWVLMGSFTFTGAHPIP